MNVPSESARRGKARAMPPERVFIPRREAVVRSPGAARVAATRAHAR